MEFDISDYQIVKTIGRGSFGKVALTKYKKEKIYYAMKILKKYEILRLNQLQHIYSEYTILRELDHPFIVFNFLRLGETERNQTR
jgi:protein kinase X